MAFELGHGIARNLQTALALGGDGRNLLLHTEDFSNAVWETARGSGSIDTTLAAGYKPGTNRGARITDSGGFEPLQDVGGAGDYSEKTLTFSCWIRPISGCTNLGIELRHEAAASTARADFPTPTLSKWKHLSVTHTFPVITDKAQILISNDDPNSPGAVWEIMHPQVEEAGKASEYVHVTDGTTPLQTILDAIEARYEDGIELKNPDHWLLGHTNSIKSVPSWPCGFVLVSGGTLDAHGMSGVGAGSATGTLTVNVGVMARGEPALPGVLRERLHRLLIGCYERIMDAEMGNELGTSTMGAGPVGFDMRSGIATESEMFGAASISLNFGITETR